MRKLTIAKRIQLSNFISIAMILVVGFLSFHYLNRLHYELDQLVSKDIQLTRLAEEIKTGVFELQRAEHLFLQAPGTLELQRRVSKVLTTLRHSIAQAQNTSSERSNIRRYIQINELADTYQSIHARIALGTAEHRDHAALSNLRAKIRSINSEVLAERYKALEQHQHQASRVASNAERNMIIMLIIVLVFAVILGVASPKWVSSPFHRLQRALAEVRTGKLNTVIAVRTDDEVGALTKTLNSTIAGLREFDDLKVQRIAFERRRFEALANMVDYGVIVVEHDGHIRFVNSQLYLLLGLSSEDVVDRKIDQSEFPESLRTLLHQCIASDDKFDNHEFELTIRNGDDQEQRITLLADNTICQSQRGRIEHYIVTLEDKGAHAQKHYLKRKIAGSENT